MEEMLYCRQCKNRPVQAVESNCCGGLYCWSCAFEVNHCDMCNKPLNPEKYHSALSVQRILNRSRSNPQQSESEDTTNSPLLRSRSSHSSDYFDEVAAPVPRSILAKLKYPCPENCGANDLTEQTASTHLELHCPNVKQVCKHVGCNQKVERSKIDQHEQEDCDFITMLCPYNCGAIYKRNLDQHNVQSTEAHMQYLLETTQNQRKQIEEIQSNSNNNNNVFGTATVPLSLPSLDCLEGRWKKIVPVVVLLCLLKMLPVIFSLPILVFGLVKYYPKVNNYFYRKLVNSGRLKPQQQNTNNNNTNNNGSKPFDIGLFLFHASMFVSYFWFSFVLLKILMF